MKSFFFALTLCALAHAQQAPDPCLERPIFVGVTDGRWHALSHLQASNFEGTLDGKPVEIESIKENGAPKRLVILIDRSRSMASNGWLPGEPYRDPDRYAGEVQLVEQLANIPLAGTGVGIFTFSLETEPVLTFEEPISSFLGKIDKLPPAHGRTALWDAVAIATASLDHPGPEDAVIVFSDGGDNSSKIHKESDVRKLVLDSGVRLFAVQLPSDFGLLAEDESEGVRRLKELARLTGGEFLGFEFPSKKQKDAFAEDARASGTG